MFLVSQKEFGFAVMFTDSTEPMILAAGWLYAHLPKHTVTLVPFEK